MKRALDEGRAAAPHGHGAPMRQPQESVYYHPVTNPTGAPPPGRPQRYKDDVDLMDPSKADAPAAPHRTRTAHDVAEPSGAAADESILPPPDEPPPGILPPPDGPCSARYIAAARVPSARRVTARVSAGDACAAVGPSARGPATACRASPGVRRHGHGGGWEGGKGGGGGHGGRSDGAAYDPGTA